MIQLRKCWYYTWNSCLGMTMARCKINVHYFTLLLANNLNRKKMFTQLESQLGMILIFDRDHVSTVPGSRITKVFRKTFFQFSQSFKNILLSNISKFKQMPWRVLRVWQIITCSSKSGLPWLCKKECRKGSGGGPLWQSCLPKNLPSSCHICRIPTQGPLFWITCNRLKLLRKAVCLQLIQNSMPSVAGRQQCCI